MHISAADSHSAYYYHITDLCEALIDSRYPTISMMQEICWRYYQSDKELVEVCGLLHAFLSAEDGFTGGTRFEIEYAVSLNIPLQVHWKNGISQWIYQRSFPFFERKQDLFLSWQDFFHKTDIELGGLK
jgi:hypothetical protein